MSQLPWFFWPFLILLALLMGFVADRTNLCTVSAVEEVISRRSARVLGNIVKIVLWVLGISTLLNAVFGFTPLNSDRFVGGWISLAGGLVFGLGATLNGGCSLQTITRLGRGNLGMIVSITGMPIGAMMARFLLLRQPEMIPTRTPENYSLTSEMQLALVLVCCLWMSWEVVRILRGFKFSQCKRRLLAPEYQPASSAALLGIANGVLFALVGSWMFTFVLIQSMTNLAYPGSVLYRPMPHQLWWLLAAYVVGIIGSAIQSRHALFQATPRKTWLRYFFGGVFMGLGAALVPGGNDMLLLNSMPGLSPHAVPGYLAMLAGIGISLAVMGRVFPDNDTC
jgi:uncharacterized membrane protein YedE/YeeE